MSSSVFRVTPVFRACVQEGRTFWYGPFVIVVRLLETSALVFFGGGGIKALFASFVCMIAIVVQREYEPYVEDSDDKVAYLAQWVVFAWIFSLQIHNELDSLPPNVWGGALVVLLLVLVGYSVRAGYSDLYEKRRKVIVSNDGN